MFIFNRNVWNQEIYLEFYFAFLYLLYSKHFSRKQNIISKYIYVYFQSKTIYSLHE